MFRITRRPSSASGSFTWSADFDNSLTSREWTAGSGTTTISEMFSGNGKTTYP